MRRALAMVLVACCWIAWAPPSVADQCKYCHQELPDGVNPLQCPHCKELAEKIKRHNPEVWVLDFKQGNLGRVQIKDDTGTPEDYWFLPYTLTNTDAVPHSFFIEVTATSDQGRRTYHYHDTYIPDVYHEARRILGKREGDQLLAKRQLSMPPSDEKNVPPEVGDKRTRKTAQIALPTIQPGETLHCVALFGPFDAQMDRLVISIRGLTNSSLLAHDDYVAPEGSPNRRLIKEAVLTLHYSRPGDEFVSQEDPIRFEGRRWIDVPRTVKSDLR